MGSRRHPEVDVTTAAAAGLRETMRRLGHAPDTRLESYQGSDHVTVACAHCSVALTAYIDHANERVELTGEALRLRCERE